MTSSPHPENTVEHWFEQYKSAIESVGRLVIRAEAAEAESARWKASFDGHVYVKNEEYSALVSRANTAEAERDELFKTLRDWTEQDIKNRDYFKAELAKAEAESARLVKEVKTCPRCKGTGDDPVQCHPDHHFACDLCDGQKLVKVREQSV